MPLATMTSKGQLTVPKEVREALGLDTGSKVLFVRTSTGQYLLRSRRHSIMDLRGSVPYDGPPVSVEAMDQAIGEALVEDDERIKREWSDG